jgi:putative metallohydrolase (TIGR04338 family)
VPVSPRDSQRSRVYRAETPLGGRHLPTLPDCAAYLDEVVGSLWWLARFPERDLFRVPRLRPGHGARQAFYREEPDGPTITLPRRYRTTAVVLHELVHWALADAVDLPNHGRTFTRILLDATAEFLGSAKRERLAAGYAEHKVHIARPPRRGPDGSYDYGWDERLRLGRGRLLVVGFGTDEACTGVLVSRAHHRVRLRTAAGEEAIPERDIWSVRPGHTDAAQTSAAATAAPKRAGSSTIG